MSTRANTEALAGQGEFHASIQPSKPMTTHGVSRHFVILNCLISTANFPSQHQLGQKVGNDAVPEFHAQTYPAGTAPKESSFHPNPTSEIPGQGNNDLMDQSSKTSPLDMPGATSKDVYNESPIGRPVKGQGDIDRRRAELGGLEGLGHHPRSMEKRVGESVGESRTDLPQGVGGNVRSKGIPAEERLPESAERVAAEKNQH